MKFTNALLAGAAALSLLAAPLAAFAQDAAPSPKGGTLKGAAVGGVAGHMMGHTKTGAAVGAMAGHHEKAKSEDRISQGKQP